MNRFKTPDSELRANLERLIDRQQPLNLTMYAETDTDVSPEAIALRQIKMKNLLKDLRLRHERQRNYPQVERLIDKVEDILPDIARQAGNGSIIVLANKRYLDWYIIPRLHHSRAYIGSKFVLDPLELIINQTQNLAYVLELNQDQPRLYAVRVSGIRQLRLDDMPPPLPQALHLDEAGRELQTHPVARYGNREIESFHGHGWYKDPHKKLIVKYLRLVDKTINRHIRIRTKPLFLVGPEYIKALYRLISDYPNIHSFSFKGKLSDLEVTFKAIIARLKPQSGRLRRAGYDIR